MSNSDQFNDQSLGAEQVHDISLLGKRVADQEVLEVAKFPRSDLSSANSGDDFAQQSQYKSALSALTLLGAAIPPQV